MISKHDADLTATFRFASDGSIPNHPHFPLVVYRHVLPSVDGDGAAAIEALFAANGWGGFWRNGVHSFHHFHSTCHEALGVARGWADIRFGGEGGETLRIAAGDVAVLPAGTGHRRIDASADFLVVGAYPRDQPFDLLKGAASEHDAAVERIREVPRPATDPVFGQDDGVRVSWTEPG